jgi:hypothetical protein
VHTRPYLILSLVAIFLIATSCKLFSKKDEGQLIAECYGNYLYNDDLDGIVQPGTSANDSIAAVKQFIDNWIRQQIMLHQAENNLDNEQKNFDDQIRQYRNSLIIYAYETELIKQKLDTLVSPQQIEDFYNSNQDNFLLLENIVRVKYVKIPAVSAKPDVLKKAEKLLRSNNADDNDKLLDLCQSAILTCFTDDENWIRFDDLLREVPIKTDDPEQFLKNRNFYQATDSTYVYMVKFSEVKTKEGVSPLSFETARIRDLILNRRKIELMDKIQQQAFQEAMNNNEFTVY